MKRSKLLPAVVLALACWRGTAFSAEPEAKVAIESREKGSNCFGDSKQDWRFFIKSKEALQGRATWVFALDQRTLARGEAPLKIAANQMAPMDVRLQMPSVKEGVILRGRLDVAVLPEGTKEPTARLGKTVWIFPTDAFAGRGGWLKGLKITLFDPAEKTTELFKKLALPFDETRNVAALGELKEGLVIIGEGVSFREYRDLPETMLKMASRGVAVLCLAPAEGNLLIPGTVPQAAPPQRLSWRRRDVIADLDKRLDVTGWPSRGHPVLARVAPIVEEGQLVGKIQADGDAWPWMEAEYPGRKGRLLVCGFGLVRDWEAGPTPRFLLVRLFERLTDVNPPPRNNKECNP